jgi:hypothetical protein
MTALNVTMLAGYGFFGKDKRENSQLPVTFELLGRIRTKDGTGEVGHAIPCHGMCKFN